MEDASQLSLALSDVLQNFLPRVHAQSLSNVDELLFGSIFSEKFLEAEQLVLSWLQFWLSGAVPNKPVVHGSVGALKGRSARNADLVSLARPHDRRNHCLVDY